MLIFSNCSYLLDGSDVVSAQRPDLCLNRNETQMLHLRRELHAGVVHGYGVMVGMLRERFMMRRTSTSGRLSCLVWAQPSSAAAMCRSKRSDTDFFLSLGFPLKKEPSHCLITLSIFSVLKTKMLDSSCVFSSSLD